MRDTNTKLEFAYKKAKGSKAPLETFIKLSLREYPWLRREYLTNIWYNFYNHKGSPARKYKWLETK